MSATNHKAGGFILTTTYSAGTSKESSTDSVLYSGLLALCHDEGIKSLDVEIVQYPNDSNGFTAVAKSRLEFQDGRRFGEIGDANKGNVKPNIAPHFIRMAATRAKARAMRDAVNIAVVCEEELEVLSPHAKREFMEEKVRFLRWVTDWRRSQDVEPSEGMRTPDWIVAAVKHLFGADTIENRDQLSALGDAIERGDYDPETGERIPETIAAKL
jgi:hypothetical protein